MHVTRVELENIKSYERAEFTFEPGTTAIVGPNGAGKTTILEAIAWALFDTLEYSKEDFLRRGAKKGSVRVTFESELDERQYTVYRDTGTGYYVYDPGLKLRLAEKKTDVVAFLRQHLGVEPGTDLKSLFRYAIGVPQGFLTADFNDKPAERKQKFDRLLKVEEYREAADRLRDTVNLIRERAAEVRARIAGVEGQLAHYDELKEEHRSLSERVSEQIEALEALEREAEERASVVSEMDGAERRTIEARAAVERLMVEETAALRRLADVRREYEIAALARERQQATETAYHQHTAALNELHRLEALRRERDRLRQEAEQVTRQLDRTEAEAHRLEEALAASVCARIALTELSNLIEEQEALELERERLRDLRALGVAAGEQLVRLDGELGILRQQHAQTKERIKAAEAAKSAQQDVERLESDRLAVDLELSQAREAMTAHAHLTSGRRAAEHEVERLRGVIDRLEAEAAELEAAASGALGIAVIELRERELGEEVAHLRAEIARDEKMLREVKDGLCPILSERCLNIGKDRTLDSYFKDQLATNTERLARVESERTQAALAVRTAREAGLAEARLGSARARLEHERALMRERVAALTRLDDELATIAVAADAKRRRELEIQLGGIDIELKQARDAVLRYAEMDSLRARLKEIEEEGRRKKEERASLDAASGAVAALEAEILEVENRLRALNDPRGRAASLRHEADREERLKVETEAVNASVCALKAQEAALQEQLNGFSEIDAEWAESLASRERTAEAYREYLQYAQAAAMLETRQAEVEGAETEAKRLAGELERAREVQVSTLAAYDAARHATERALLISARERLAAAGAQLAAMRERLDAMQAEIARLDQVRASLQTELQAKARLEKLHEATDFVRDTLKKAGPLVTESYLYNVSIEANGLFREITGEAARALRWSLDYEIILEEAGYERSFANLSGGEQMAAALSVRLALLKQLSDIRIAFFDEPTINMDAERRERLAQQIGQVRHFKQLFVISHDDTFEETVDHVVTLAREEQEAA